LPIFTPNTPALPDKLNFSTMKPGKKAKTAVILFIFYLIITWFSSDTQRVEKVYSNRFYPVFSSKLRILSGFTTISIGDILIGWAIVWLIIKIARLLFYLFSGRKKLIKQKIYPAAAKMLLFCGSIFIIFYLSWGINYHRKGISGQLDLDSLSYERADLKNINCLLIDKINESKNSLMLSKKPYPSNTELFQLVKEAYEQLSKQYPYLRYNHPSLKSSLWGWFGNYSGFAGYYNPLTGEAQVNTSIPKFLQPFTACHEVAHQIGYAKEMEANFVGYLAAAASKDTLLHYSVYLDLFTYANRNLSMVDSLSARQYRRELIQPVKDDINEWINFDRKHRNAMEPLVKWVYGKYLEGNEQPKGILSYDEVTAFIIAYYKKFGKI
jgi:uncharacterized membrane protein SirB2